MFEKNKIFDTLKRKGAKIVFYDQINTNNIKNIIDKLITTKSNEYPYFKNVRYQIISNKTNFNHQIVVEFYYDNETYNDDNQNTKLNENCVYEINDIGQSSFIPYMKISNGYIFEIKTTNLQRLIKIIEKEMPTIIALEEGVNTVNIQTSQYGSIGTIRCEFIFGMPLTQFLDHREKGIKKAEIIYNQITHKGDLPVTIVALLVCAYLQKNVKYDFEYTKHVNNHIDGDKHMSYGALVRKSAVCEGYAWAFINIMKQMNVEVKISMGLKDGVSHSWSIIKINNQWYNVETTINYQEGCILVYNFLVSDETLIERGYKIGQRTEKCVDTKYENFEIIKHDLKTNLDYYIRKGANVDLIKSNFCYVKNSN